MTIVRGLWFPNFQICIWLVVSGLSKLKSRPMGPFNGMRCIVARDFNQFHMLDYEETFSLVLKPSTIHLILTLALFQGWSLKQLDVSNAFMHSDL